MQGVERLPRHRVVLLGFVWTRLAKMKHRRLGTKGRLGHCAAGGMPLLVHAGIGMSIVFAYVGCGQHGDAPAPGAADGGEAVGTECTPGRELSATFGGSRLTEVTVETGSAGGPACVEYHFQGRTGCPYGQDAQGAPPKGAAPCTTTAGAPVTVMVLPQCVDRKPTSAIFWSCRCANAQGAANDGASYCTCPAATTCSLTISSLGPSSTSGTYCLPSGATYDANTTCSATCDPATHPCL
jgi:hypothetical protein